MSTISISGLGGAAPTASDPGTNPTLPPTTFDTSATAIYGACSRYRGSVIQIKITSNGQVNVTGLQYAWEYSINGGSWATGSGSSFTVTGDGDYSVTVRQQNAYEVWQPASAPLEFTLDTASPTVSITSSESSPTNAVPIPITVTFSEDVTGSALGDVTVGNGTSKQSSWQRRSIYSGYHAVGRRHGHS